MDIRTPTESDWKLFDWLVAAEGWRVPVHERTLFSTVWRNAAGVLCDGRFGGLVTAVCHVPTSQKG